MAAQWVGRWVGVGNRPEYQEYIFERAGGGGGAGGFSLDYFTLFSV